VFASQERKKRRSILATKKEQNHQRTILKLNLKREKDLRGVLLNQKGRRENYLFRHDLRESNEEEREEVHDCKTTKDQESRETLFFFGWPFLLLSHHLRTDRSSSTNKEFIFSRTDKSDF
jgi:hypothetical protein